MKIFELATRLKAIYDEHGDIEVFFRDPNTDQGPFEVGRVAQRTAEEDEYPEDYNMPEGYKFVELTH
jgi:hypothetical protein